MDKPVDARNLAVARVTRNIGNQSYIGFIGTKGNTLSSKEFYGIDDAEDGDKDSRVSQAAGAARPDNNKSKAMAKKIIRNIVPITTHPKIDNTIVI